MCSEVGQSSASASHTSVQQSQLYYSPHQTRVHFSDENLPYERTELISSDARLGSSDVQEQPDGPLAVRMVRAHSNFAS